MRTNGFDEVDGAPLVLLNLEACVKQEDFGKRFQFSLAFHC